MRTSVILIGQHVEPFYEMKVPIKGPYVSPTPAQAGV